MKKIIINVLSVMLFGLIIGMVSCGLSVILNRCDVDLRTVIVALICPPVVICNGKFSLKRLLYAASAIGVAYFFDLNLLSTISLVAAYSIIIAHYSEPLQKWAEQLNRK